MNGCSWEWATLGETNGSVTEIGGVGIGELGFGELAIVRLAGEVYSDVDSKRKDGASDEDRERSGVRGEVSL